MLSPASRSTFEVVAKIISTSEVNHAFMNRIVDGHGIGGDASIEAGGTRLAELGSTPLARISHRLDRPLPMRVGRACRRRQARVSAALWQGRCLRRRVCSWSLLVWAEGG